MNDIEKIHAVLNVATQQLVNVSFATGGAVMAGIIGWGTALQERYKPTFEEAFAATGFQYGYEALDNVRLGWELAHGKLYGKANGDGYPGAERSGSRDTPCGAV